MALYLFLLDLFLEMLVLRSEKFFRYFGKLKDTVISFWNFLTFKIICTYKYFLSLIYRWSIWDLFSILELIWETSGISWTLLWSAVLSSLFIILWRKFFYVKLKAEKSQFDFIIKQPTKNLSRIKQFESLLPFYKYRPRLFWHDFENKKSSGEVLQRILMLISLDNFSVGLFEKMTKIEIFFWDFTTFDNLARFQELVRC